MDTVNPRRFNLSFRFSTYFGFRISFNFRVRSSNKDPDGEVGNTGKKHNIKKYQPLPLEDSFRSKTIT